MSAEIQTMYKDKDRTQVVYPRTTVNAVKDYDGRTINQILDAKAEESELGINIWDEEWEVGGYDTSGQKDTSDDRIRSKSFIPVIPGKKYYLHCGQDTDFFVSFYDKDKTFIERINEGNDVEITNNANAYYITFFLYKAGHLITSYDDNITINLSNSLYNGTYYPSVGIRRDMQSKLNSSGADRTLNLINLAISGHLNKGNAITDLNNYYGELAVYNFTADDSAVVNKPPFTGTGGSRLIVIPTSATDGVQLAFNLVTSWEAYMRIYYSGGATFRAWKRIDNV